MKKHITGIQTIVLITVGLLVSNLSSAQTVKDSNSFISTASVQHLQSSENNTTFKVKLLNEEGAKFSVTVKDNYGNQLFGEIYQDKVFDKKFHFENLNELGEHTITIKSFKGDAAQTFKVNAVTRVVRDVVINRL